MNRLNIPIVKRTYYTMTGQHFVKLRNIKENHPRTFQKLLLHLSGFSFLLHTVLKLAQRLQLFLTGRRYEAWK